MLDIKFVRDNQELVQRKLEQRGSDVDLPPVLAADEKRRRIIQEVESLKHERKVVSERIAQAKKSGEDAANAIATAIGTRALSPRSAVILAAIFNFAGAATGLEVARTIGKGILIPEAITYLTMIAALASVIAWTALATYRGLPVSLTHGFVVALAASGAASVGGEAVVWGIMARVLAAVVTAPLLGFAGGFALMVCLYWIFRRTAPDKIRSLFSRLQIPAAAFVAYAHGKNDGQMPVGVITMALVAF